MKGYALTIKSYNDIDRCAGSCNGLVGEADLVDIVSAPDPRFIILTGEDVITGSRKYPCQGIAYRLYPLPCFSADLDRIVQAPSDAPL